MCAGASREELDYFGVGGSSQEELDYCVRDCGADVEEETVLGGECVVWL